MDNIHNLIEIAIATFRTEYFLYPNTLIISYSDYYLILSERPDLESSGVYKYQGMTIIRTEDIKNPQVALCHENF